MIYYFGQRNQVVVRGLQLQPVASAGLQNLILGAFVFQARSDGSWLVGRSAITRAAVDLGLEWKLMQAETYMCSSFKQTPQAFVTNLVQARGRALGAGPRAAPHPHHRSPRPERGTPGPTGANRSAGRVTGWDVRITVICCAQDTVALAISGS